MEAHALAAEQRRSPRARLRRLAGDDRLVELVRAGSPEAFEAVYDRYHRQILSFCRHMLGSREEAEDAVQHSFMAAYNHLVASDKAIQLRPWLFTIARNHSLSLLRARRDQTSLEDVEPAVEGLASEVQRRQDLRDMLRDVAALPEDQREALVLAELGALSHDEIGEVLRCPREKVKALVFQARSSLAASRQARDTPCQEIREQLSTLTGGALRRTHLRRHLRDCPGCREFQAEVHRQRAAMAVLLPVVPSLGLKGGVLASVGIGHAAAGGAAAGAGGVAGLVAGAGIGKIVAGIAVVAAGVGGGVAAVEAIDDGPPRTLSAPPASPPVAEGAAAGASGAARGAVVATASPARGEHSLGKSGPVANGRNPKGDRGRSATAPGRAGTSPGRAGTAPGRLRTTRGRADAAPGRVAPTPGRSGTAPRTPSDGAGTRSGTPDIARGPADRPGAAVRVPPAVSGEVESKRSAATRPLPGD